MQGYNAARKAGTAGVVACTSEPSSIYSCSHVQHAQETGDLPPLSTSGIKASLLYWGQPPVSQENTEVSYPSLTHHHLYNQALPGERRALASKPCSKSGGNRTWLLHIPRDALIAGLADQNRTDRHIQVRPWKMHPFPPTHTQRLEHLLDWPHRQCRWGMILIPLKQGQGSQFWDLRSA